MDVAEYLQGLPEPQRSTLQVLRDRVRAALPDADEVMAYGMPAFRVEQGLVAGYAAATHHCAYYPMSGTVLAGLADRVAGYDCGKGTLRFPLDEPLPADLVSALVRARLAELAR